MLLDSLNQFASAQAITADAISENVIDLGPLGGATANTIRDIGAGKTLYLHIVVSTTLDSAADGTSLITSLESSAVVGLTSATVHYTGPDIEEATLVAGAWIAEGIAIPAGAYLQYLGLRFNVGSEEDFTSGAINAWLSDSRVDTRTYESGYTTGVN